MKTSPQRFFPGSPEIESTQALFIFLVDALNQKEDKSITQNMDLFQGSLFYYLRNSTKLDHYQQFFEFIRNQFNRLDYFVPSEVLSWEENNFFSKYDIVFVIEKTFQLLHDSYQQIQKYEKFNCKCKVHYSLSFSVTETIESNCCEGCVIRYQDFIQYVDVNLILNKIEIDLLEKLHNVPVTLTSQFKELTNFYRLSDRIFDELGNFIQNFTSPCREHDQNRTHKFMIGDLPHRFFYAISWNDAKKSAVSALISFVSIPCQIRPHSIYDRNTGYQIAYYLEAYLFKNKDRCIYVLYKEGKWVYEDHYITWEDLLKIVIQKKLFVGLVTYSLTERSITKNTENIDLGYYEKLAYEYDLFEKN